MSAEPFESFVPFNLKLFPADKYLPKVIYKNYINALDIVHHQAVFII